MGIDGHQQHTVRAGERAGLSKQSPIAGAAAAAACTPNVNLLPLPTPLQVVSDALYLNHSLGTHLFCPLFSHSSPLEVITNSLPLNHSLPTHFFCPPFSNSPPQVMTDALSLGHSLCKHLLASSPGSAARSSRPSPSAPQPSPPGTGTEQEGAVLGAPWHWAAGEMVRVCASLDASYAVQVRGDWGVWGGSVGDNWGRKGAGKRGGEESLGRWRVCVHRWMPLMPCR